MKRRGRGPSISSSSSSDDDDNSNAATWQCSSLLLVVLLTLISSGIKLLLLPSYRSTDFEVHRNWLAITSSLPLREWYFNDTSIWTMDYPPFFGYFELFLSFFAKFFDPAMLIVNNLEYSSFATIAFQRFSVIATDLLLVISSYLLISTSRLFTKLETGLTLTLVIFNAGLLIVDHVHFQYNGMLLGILILIIYLAESQRYLFMAAMFCVLVLMKHLFVTLAPVFVVYLLFNYCYAISKEASSSMRNGNKNSNNTNNTNNTNKTNNTNNDFNIHQRSRTRQKNLMKLVCIVITLLLLAFGPIIYSTCYEDHKSTLTFTSRSVVNIAETSKASSSNPSDSVNTDENDALQLSHPFMCVYGTFKQILSRLFPFGRGIVHAYWAPNVYALYCFADKILAKLLKLPITADAHSPASSALLSSTSGRVGDFQFIVLHGLSPSFAMLLVIWPILDVCIALMKKPLEKLDKCRPGDKLLVVPIDTITLIKATITASFSTYMFGYHVHEKAILVPLVLQTFLVARCRFSAELFHTMAVSSLYSLFPLLYQSQELIVKVLIYVCYISLSRLTVEIFHSKNSRNKSNASKNDLTLPLDDFYTRLYIKYLFKYTLWLSPYLMALLFLFCEIIFPVFVKGKPWGDKFEFLPLMMTSVVCAIVNIVCYIGCMIQFHDDEPR